MPEKPKVPAKKAAPVANKVKAKLLKVVAAKGKAVAKKGGK